MLRCNDCVFVNNIMVQCALCVCACLCGLYNMVTRINMCVYVLTVGSYSCRKLGDSSAIQDGCVKVCQPRKFLICINSWFDLTDSLLTSHSRPHAIVGTHIWRAWGEPWSLSYCLYTTTYSHRWSCVHISYISHICNNQAIIPIIIVVFELHISILHTLQYSLEHPIQHQPETWELRSANRPCKKLHCIQHWVVAMMAMEV